MTRVGIITQARMTSTRLPGKVLLAAGGRTLLDHHIDRLQKLDLPLVVATTTNASDDPIAALAVSRGARVFRGSETDVLGRFAGAARDAGLDVVVRVTSDCPPHRPRARQAGRRAVRRTRGPHRTRVQRARADLSPWLRFRGVLRRCASRSGRTGIPSRRSRARHPVPLQRPGSRYAPARHHRHARRVALPRHRRHPGGPRGHPRPRRDLRRG
ncbi:hypothetical protein JM654_13600 [Microbacterium oxydans]|nr:hypothetical protein [Microbacterium oxydans]